MKHFCQSSLDQGEKRKQECIEIKQYMQHDWKYMYFELQDRGYELLQNDDILGFKEQPINLTKKCKLHIWPHNFSHSRVF